VIKKISSDHRILGITSVGDELFVLLRRDDNLDQIAVYSIKDFKLLHHLNLPPLQAAYVSDMASCERRKCLYMTEHDEKSILRYDLASGDTSKWPVRGKPCGLSVTSSYNLLVACREPNKLVELSADSGECLQEIVLQSDIENLWHGEQLATGQFVVCHGSRSRVLHRVCEVGIDGKLLRSYGGQWGCETEQLDCPFSLAVDRDSQFIFVADYKNDRVVLLSPTLEFVRYVSEGLTRPCQLYLHQSTRHLFVGQWGEGVIIIQL